MKKRLEYLTKKLKNVDFETKYRKSFEKEARYQGNGIYFWHDILSSDIKEVFLLGCLAREGIKVKDR